MHKNSFMNTTCNNSVDTCRKVKNYQIVELERTISIIWSNPQDSENPFKP